MMVKMKIKMMVKMTVKIDGKNDGKDDGKNDGKDDGKNDGKDVDKDDGKDVDPILLSQGTRLFNQLDLLVEDKNRELKYSKKLKDTGEVWLLLSDLLHRFKSIEIK